MTALLEALSDLDESPDTLPPTPVHKPLEVQVQNMLDQAKDNAVSGPNIADFRDRELLAKHFYSTFDKDAFLPAFSGLKNTWISMLPDPTRSGFSEVRILAMLSMLLLPYTNTCLHLDIWANLAAQIKLNLDMEAQGEATLARGHWCQILEYWDVMGKQPRFEQVKLASFKQRAERPKRQRTAKTSTSLVAPKIARWLPLRKGNLPADLPNKFSSGVPDGA
ncbi:uncharacterized protein N7515_008648 [Penicillium bovifimosum]|uniref:Uncharacterized protein n=1 Tax=Penicillium bovifimosum TaxID=126998 RepID=A0A9W9KY12_9EURO|nr:uncharacterized protein N7515_008648 [Penicillium bovifimosum]KAJ5124823.1 hypothetical protein N7515_008648 [Penicillium bovifimosum]